jgi:uracil-DNA glycosylase
MVKVDLNESNIKNDIQERLKLALGEEWYALLHEEFTKPYMVELGKFVSSRRKLNIVYPDKEDVFNAYKLTPYSKARICIIGLDPYINKDEAHGIAFSTKYGTSTPSLKQIANAVITQAYKDDPYYVWINNLERWANQGVMLLNSVLTVDAGKTRSHANQGWEDFIARTIQILDEKGILFMLWGADANKLARHITKSKVLSCEHPQAPNYRATNKEWNNLDCFNTANNLIGGRKIMW